jgi:hypothetical protein
MFTGMTFSRMFIMFVALPLLFIAGVQLFILSAQTDYFFAWTITLPLTAAFLGAGYWAAMLAAFMFLRQKTSIALRIMGLPSVAATGLLGIATVLHLDKFHLNSPAPLTLFVTWVWILVYVVTPFILLGMWIALGRRTDESMGAHPLHPWVRFGYIFQAGLAILAAIVLFLAPALIIPFWPWELTPLTARAISAWLTTSGVACVAIYRENDLPNTGGARASLMAFCLLEFVVLARYFSSVDWTKPLAWVYVLLLLVGVIAALPGLKSRDEVKVGS